MRIVPAVLLLLLGTLACRSASSDRDRSSGGPVPFARAFGILESRRGSDAVDRPRGTLVDYESTVLVEPDRVRLAAVAGTSDPDGTPDEIVRLQAQLADVRHAGPLLDLIAEYEEESRRFFASELDEGTILQEDARWRSFTQKQLEVVESLKQLIYIYLNQTEHEGRWNWNAADAAAMGIPETEVAAAFGQAEPLYRRVSPTAGSYDPAEVTALVNEVARILRERIGELEREVLERSPAAELEMEATLLRGKERLPVSIVPYRIVEGVGRGEKSKRVGIPSPEDAERVRREYEAYSELAGSINGLIELAGDDEKLAELREGILDALGALGERLADGLEARLRAVIEESELADVRAEAEALLEELLAVRDAVRELREGAASPDPISLTNGALAVVASIQDGVKPKLEALVARLQGLPDTLPAAADALVESFVELAAEETAQLAGALAGLPGAGSLANLVTALKKLSALAKLRSFGDLEPGTITARPFAIDQAPVGTVDLADTPAESGDVLELRYRMRVDDPEDTDEGAPAATPGNASGESRQTVHQGAQFLDVRKFGFYSTYSAQVLFYDRRDDGSSSFRAAPGVAYNLHYRPEGAQELHDLVAPGLGLSVSAPSFETGTELAVGVQATLFNDMIQAGYAYNISVDDDPWMLYFAFDLISAFRAVE